MKKKRLNYYYYLRNSSYDLLHHLNDHKIFFECILDDIFSKVESCKFILFDDIYKLSITYELKSYKNHFGLYKLWWFIYVYCKSNMFRYKKYYCYVCSSKKKKNYFVMYNKKGYSLQNKITRPTFYFTFC